MTAIVLPSEARDPHHPGRESRFRFPVPVSDLSLLDIHVLGSPILRQETKPVERMTDELRRLTDDMFDTMHAAKGIGLAAPQVGRSERIAVVDIDNNPIVVVNPEIVITEGS